MTRYARLRGEKNAANSLLIRKMRTEQAAFNLELGVSAY